MSRVAGWFGAAIVLVGICLVVLMDGNELQGECGEAKLAAALRSSGVDWDEFGWSREETAIHPIEQRGWKYLPQGACEFGFVDRPADLGSPCRNCDVALLTVVTAPTEALLSKVVANDFAHENFYPAVEVLEGHWEELIPVRFQETSGTMFSWTASGCRFVSVRWILRNVPYSETAAREMRARRFLESIPGDGCTPQT